MAYLLSAQHFPQSFIGFRFVTCHSGIDGVCFHGVSTLPYFPFNPSPPLLFLFIETWLIAKYLKFLSLCLNVIRATPAKPSIPPPPASCNVWQGLKCYRRVSWLCVGVRLPFVLDQPAALYGSNRKAVLPLVLGALNYLVELAWRRWNDWGVWGWEESLSRILSHFCLFDVHMCAIKTLIWPFQIFHIVAFLQVFLFGWTCK